MDHEEKVMSLPSPQENPDLYDGYDGRKDAPLAYSMDQIADMAPDDIKQRLVAVTPEALIGS
jgi:hypothetical protein